MRKAESLEIEIPLRPNDAEGAVLKGFLTIPSNAKGLVIFAHGSGSGRNSPRNLHVALELNQSGFATALFDLLTGQEAIEDEKNRKLRFDIDLLAERQIAITEWILKDPRTCKFNLGYYGSSTGAAAALIASARFGGSIKAVVSRGGRVDLASSAFKKLPPKLSILFLVGSNDPQTINWNQKTVEQLRQVENKRLLIVQGAGHMFEEQGKIQEVAKQAASWFQTYL
jgi:dienelactone hydrolase